MRLLIVTFFTCALTYTSAFASTHTTMPKGANPAEQFCINKGGVLKTVQQRTSCVFADGTEIDPEALLRREKPRKMAALQG